MPEFTVYTVPGSPFGRSVLIALIEKGAEWRLAPLAGGQTKTEPHLSRHPFGRVPALEHGGFMLYETQAILRYLDRVMPDPALTPADARTAARMDQVMNVNDWYLFQGVNNVIGFHRIVGPRRLGLTPDEAAIAAAMPKAQLVFKELSRLLGNGPYFVGDQMTLADIIVAPQLDFLTQTPEWATLSPPVPNLVAWLQRMTARDSFVATTWARLDELAKSA